MCIMLEESDDEAISVPLEVEGDGSSLHDAWTCGPMLGSLSSQPDRPLVLRAAILSEILCPIKSLWSLLLPLCTS